MKVSYFPGCTLKTKAKQLDKYARLCAEKLGVTLEEIPDWQCCGGVFNMADDEIATKLSAVRALKAAQDASQPLVSVCSACHNVLKQTNNAMQSDSTFASRVNNYITQRDQAQSDPYYGGTEVYHYLEMIRDLIGYDKVKEAVTVPLKGKKIACYYGCLLLRPSDVMQMDDPENPRIMEDLVTALGGEAVAWSMRNECCGGYVTLEDKGLAVKKSSAVLGNATANGADIIVTACPLCKYNLKKNGMGDIPVVYLTELMAESFGLKAFGLFEEA